MLYIQISRPVYPICPSLHVYPIFATPILFHPISLPILPSPQHPDLYRSIAVFLLHAALILIINQTPRASTAPTSRSHAASCRTDQPVDAECYQGEHEEEHDDNYGDDVVLFDHRCGGLCVVEGYGCGCLRVVVVEVYRCNRWCIDVYDRISKIQKSSSSCEHTSQFLISRFCSTRKQGYVSASSQ